MRQHKSVRFLEIRELNQCFNMRGKVSFMEIAPPPLYTPLRSLQSRALNPRSEWSCNLRGKVSPGQTVGSLTWILLQQLADYTERNSWWSILTNLHLSPGPPNPLQLSFCLALSIHLSLSLCLCVSLSSLSLSLFIHLLIHFTLI